LILQEKWVLFIIHSLLEGPIGFNELSRRAQGINTTTLTQRLMLLEQNGIVKRTVYSMMPPRTTYELTETGLALREVIDAIARWGKHYRKDTPCEPV
jgi:DNA-binding HxlR family transcriptional regulator